MQVAIDIKPKYAAFFRLRKKQQSAKEDRKNECEERMEETTLLMREITGINILR